MTLRVLLVDDEPIALQRLIYAFRDVAGVEVVGTASSGNEAVAKIDELRPDLIILDIQMPGRTGLAVAAALPREERPEIIFVTAFEHYAPDAFEVEAADYLLKPVRLERLRQAIERARRRREVRHAADRVEALELALAEARGRTRTASDDRYDAELWAPGRDGLIRVPVERIDWIEAARDYVLLHTPLRTHILRMTMSGLEKRLDPGVIMRVHRSAFVRLQAVRKLQRPGNRLMTLILDEGVEVQVSPNYASAVLRALKVENTTSSELGPTAEKALRLD